MMSLNLIPFRGDNDLRLPVIVNNLILLHPATMKKLEIKKGSPVLMTSPRGELLLRAWNCDSIDETTASLPAYSLFRHYTLNAQVSVSLFKGQTVMAERIVFVVAEMKPFMGTKEFKKFMTKTLDHLYVTEEMVLQLKYLAYPFSVTVKKIVNLHVDWDDELKANVDLDCSFTPANDNINDNSWVDSFSDKCSISKTKMHSRFQSSTPISSPKFPTQFRPCEKLNLNQLLDTSRHDITPDTNRSTKKFYSVNDCTRITFEGLDSLVNKQSKITFKDIGGLDEQLKDIRLSIDSIVKLDEGVRSRGIVITGPPGSGKSLILKAIENEYKHYLSIYNFNKYTVTRSKDRISHLQKMCEEAANNSPSLILLDEMDRLWNKENQLNGIKQEQTIYEIGAIIYRLLDSTADVLMIATTKSDSPVPTNLCKNGLLDKEIQLAVPSPTERKQILKKVLKKFTNVLSSSQISEVSDSAHGFTGRDFFRLCSKAHYLSFERKSIQGVYSDVNSAEHGIEFGDLKKGFDFIKPSFVADFTFELPNVKWSDIGGMDEVKDAVKEMVDWPLKYREKFKKLKITPARGILMYGPPGCCKTMIAKALATESLLNFINIKSSEIFSKYVGDSEKSVSELFRKARSAAPCILFFDEIDSLAPIRGSSHGNSNVTDRVVTQLLIEIDGVDVLEEGVSIIAATNRPDRIDPSLLRPGRLDRLIYVSLPNIDTRKEIFRVALQNKPLSSDIDISDLAERTENYTGAEISGVCREACMHTIQEEIAQLSKGLPQELTKLNMEHLLLALSSVKPRTTQEMIKVFETYNNKKIF